MQLELGGDSINFEQPNSKTRRGRIGHQIAQTLTCSCNQGVIIEVNDFNTNKIIRTIIPQQVRIRKFEVNIDELQQILREYKKNSNLTNKQIAENLNQPLTLVEHWFRTDKSFAIPNEDIWFDLKQLLNIDIDKFDKSIMTFEIRDGVYDKSNRVYDTNGIAPTLTVVSAENERYIIYDNKEDVNMNELIQVGMLDGKGFESRRRVYSDQGLSPTLHGIGSGGGTEPKIQIENKINAEGDNIMKNFTNNLTKYNFKMDTIRLFDSFAGIGALHHSFKELGIPIEVVGLSETDVDATISYAGGHINNFKDLEFEYPLEDEMRKLLMDRNIGWDFIKQKSCIPRLKKDKLYKVYKATILLNNLGDVSKLDYENLPDFDLFNMSFPCTDISGAGQQKGLKNADGTPTRSGLVKYGIEVIKTKRPKYIMIENVKALIQKKFIDDFYDIVNEIESYDYKCYYPKKENNKQVLLDENNYLNKVSGQPICLNAKDYGIAQNRERIFVICVRNDIDDGLFNFPEGFDNGLRLKDFLEDEVDEKYYLSQEIHDRFKLNTNSEIEDEMISGAIRGRYNEDNKVEQQLELRDDGITNTLTTVQKDNVIVESKTNELKFLGGIGDKDWVGDDKKLSRNFPQGNRVYDSEGIACSQTAQGGGLGSYTGLYKDTNDIIKIGDIPKEVLNDNERQRRVYSDEGISPTVLARTDNAKINPSNSNFRIRKLTPKECWRLMGFRDQYFDKAKELDVSDSALYKQAGNSIVVNCLYYIFKELFKKHIIE